MTVAQLRALLVDLSPELEVVIAYDGGYGWPENDNGDIAVWTGEIERWTEEPDGSSIETTVPAVFIGDNTGLTFQEDDVP